MHLPIAATFSIEDGEKTISVFYDFLDLQIIFLFFLSCHLAAELYCLVELGNFCPNPSSSSTHNSDMPTGVTQISLVNLW